MHKFLSDARGATAIEYALVAGLIALVIITAVNVLGLRTKDLYDLIVSQI